MSKKSKPTKKKPPSLKRGPGRPPKKEKFRLVVVGTRVSKRIYKKLKVQAEAQSTSISDLVRDICRAEVDKDKKKKAA